MGLVGRAIRGRACVVGLIFAVTNAAHTAAPLEEYQIKAAYMLNFARFIEWPESDSSRGPIIVGVVGTDPFGDALDSTLAGKTVRGRPFSVRRFRSVQEIDECHMLFISSSEAARIAALVQHFNKTAVLTVGDSRGFVDSGGGIGFVVADNRVRFDINLNALASARLKASAQLLEVAHALRGSLK